MKRFYAIIAAFLAVVLLLGAIFIAWREKKKAMTYEEKVTAFANENATFQKGQTVFIGDSITAGYPLRLYYRNFHCELYNRGISGDTTDWLLTRLQISLLELAPSTIVLMIGTNDINLGRPPAEIAQNYDSILHLIATELPQAQVFCVSIIPQNTKFSSDARQNNERIQETNRAIEGVVSTYGYTYVNLYDKLTDADGFLKRIYSPDGLHLGVRGYKVWTDVMKTYLQ